MPLFSFGQEFNNLTVRQQIGTDTISPSTPAFITATPVAPTQIDVSWGTSTDDQNLTGYKLFRNAVQIATTSLVTYADTGLTPSTTYSYSVAAFDWFFNVSTTSASVATTTLPLVVPSATSTQDTSSTVGGTTHPRLVDISIDTTQYGAMFSWKTNIYTRYILRWGESSEYNLGFIQSDAFRRTHLTHVSGLMSDTEYKYELIGINQMGRDFVLKQGSFTTDTAPDVTAPANVANLKAFVEGDAVRLTWQNPLDEDFTKVRVVRNHLFYPTDLVDGFIVYEGDDEMVFDAEVLSSHSEQYYTVFTYDASGNVSSGAVVQAHVVSVRQQDTSVDQKVDKSVLTAEPQATTSVGQSMELDFSYIELWQNEVQLMQSEDTFTVSSKDPITAKIAYELLPEHLKAIVFTTKHDDGTTHSYIMRINHDRSAYAALISPLPSGIYTISFELYDFKTKKLTNVEGVVISEHPAESTTGNVVSTQWLLRLIIFITIILLLFLFFWLLIIFKRQREDN